ncbi:MAG: nucleotidyltransferase domain-containing protein [Burkholderiales bacterium]|nr:nucleotidyltransferase domain-containing protein [Burkholderiales bacterium]MDE2078512.1 nucleotidyltransferase domain-containing protein [Burkholderiales bacterium]MDE2433817.1 nucleotidyltransferase domain-containing protein [Burkholderiales bacterium]
MNTPSPAIDLNEVARHLRQAFPQALAIYAFGSQIRGEARPDSDLDLAILVGGYADPATLWQTAHELADLTHTPVDLLDLRAASTVMQHQVLTTGERLWGQEPQASLFECFVMSEKNHLDEARRPLLQDIAAQGRVYG